MMESDRRARFVFSEIQSKINDIEYELEELHMQRRVVQDYLVVLHGPCNECQNAHWPHCGDDNES